MDKNGHNVSLFNPRSSGEYLPMGAATNSMVAKIMVSVFPSANYPIVI